MNASPRVLRVDRQEFLTRYWDYQPGEHVSILGPTGAGKTYLGYQLLEYAAKPALPAVTFVMKPRDETALRFSKKLHMPVIHSWPVPVMARLRHGRPPGWTLWAKHTFDPHRDDLAHQKLFYGAIRDTYKRGNFILFGDEVYSLAKELKLEKPLVTVWTKGRSMGTGLWAATQRPAYVPLWMYSMASHLFLAYDPDQRARQRLREISGMDPFIIESILKDLPRYSWLYVHAPSRTLCVVGP